MSLIPPQFAEEIRQPQNPKVRNPHILHQLLLEFVSMQFRGFKTKSTEDPLYLRRGVSKARNIGMVGPTERAFSLLSTLWPHVTKKRPERIKVVPITLPNNPQQQWTWSIKD
jgi:hypothetical protein